MHDFLVRLPHIRRHSISVQVHRGTDVRVTHELLLHADRREKPTPAGRTRGAGAS
jgi:hypothetical protein